MIATSDSTADTMSRALTHTLSALDAAQELDVDLRPEDKAALAEERAALEPILDGVEDAESAARKHSRRMEGKAQARVEIGDRVLDRGVRRGKARMKVELKGSAMPDGADHVFGANIEDVVDAELKAEPGVVKESTGRFGQVPDFPGKAAMKTDLDERAARQESALKDRDMVGVDGAVKDSALTKLIADASVHLYRLEKRLYDRFPRERAYVRSFFLNVRKASKSKIAPPA